MVAQVVMRKQDRVNRVPSSPAKRCPHLMSPSVCHPPVIPPSSSLLPPTPSACFILQLCACQVPTAAGGDGQGGHHPPQPAGIWLDGALYMRPT